MAARLESARRRANGSRSVARRAYVPQIETMEIQLCATKSKYVDSLEVLYGLPPDRLRKSRLT